jgi:hypothetical protein
VKSTAYSCNPTNTLCTDAGSVPRLTGDAGHQGGDLVTGTYSVGHWVADLYGPAGEASVYFQATSKRRAAPGSDVSSDNGVGKSCVLDFRAARRAAAKARRFCAEHQLDRMFTFTYAVGTTDWREVQRDMVIVVKTLRKMTFGGHPFPYVWVVGVNESGHLHTHLALGVDIGDDTRKMCWLDRGLSHGPLDDQVDAWCVGVYMDQNIVAAEKRFCRPPGAHRSGTARGFGVTLIRSRVASREAGIAMCIAAMGGEVPSYRWASQDWSDGPPRDFLSWRSSSNATSCIEEPAGSAGGLGRVSNTAPHGPGPRVAVADAWLAVALTDGPVDSTEIKDAAHLVGISLRTLQRARGAMGISIISSGYPRKTRWARPACISVIPTKASASRPAASMAPQPS